MDTAGPRQDIVTSLAICAIRHAAAALRQTLGDGAALSVVSATLGTSQEISAHFGVETWRQPAIAVQQRFDGALAGHALLIFRETQSLHLVRSLLADTVPMDVMTDFEQDTLTELGNVVLNGFLANLASQLGARLTSTLPQYFRGTAGGMVEAIATAADPLLFLSLDFTQAAQAVRGYLVVIFEPSSAKFRGHVDSYQPNA